jgi:hypothetical protein
MTEQVETDYDTGWREGYEAASGAARQEIERLRAALEAAHTHVREHPKPGCAACEALVRLRQEREMAQAELARLRLMLSRMTEDI